MSVNRTFSADTEDALWQQVAADLATQESLLDYSAVLHQGGYQFVLDIDIDLGGGFEGGFETTTLSAVVPGRPALHFALHEQDWVHEIGKFLGLEDIELGYPELDEAFIITTNDPAALQSLLADPALRQTLLRYPEARLTLAPATDEAGAEVLLSFSLDAAIIEPAELREVYHLLHTLLRQTAPLSSPTV